MPSKPKHDYNIMVIADLCNKGWSIRKIARSMGWPETNTQMWIHRNFTKTVTFTKRET